MLSPVDEVKNKLDVVEVVSGYIKLQKAGKNFRANCPFHHEKTPSFFVSPERQSWHCFGCGAGGSIFDFVMQIEGVEFVDALRTLAQKAGVILKKEDPQLRSDKQRLYEICELAAKFFEKQLAATKKGEGIVEYLIGRGIRKEVINGWRIGYAPDDWRALLGFLEDRGYKANEIERAGLVILRESKSEVRDPRSKTQNSKLYYDRFRNRIIFPIFDLNGRAVGFSGRVLPEDKQETAKYINTPETPLYDKSRLLYGLDRAKMEIRQQDFCIVVEGYTDVLMSHQAGLKNTVATCGTALTEDQLKIIRRYSENLVLAFDMDLAGDSATKRGIDLAIAEGLNVKIVPPEARSGNAKEDPADIIKKSPERWQTIVKSAQGVIEYYFASALLKNDPKEVSGKKAIAKLILPVLKRIPDTVERAYWLSELSKRLGVQEKFLIEALDKIKMEKSGQDSSQKKGRGGTVRPKTRILALEEEFLVLLVDVLKNAGKPSEQELVHSAEANDLLSEPQLREILISLQAYIKSNKKNDNFDLGNWQRDLPPELSSRLNHLLFQLEAREVDRCHVAADPLECCLRELKKEKIRQRCGVLQNEIGLAETAGDKKKLDGLLREFSSLIKTQDI